MGRGGSVNPSCFLNTVFYPVHSIKFRSMFPSMKIRKRREEGKRGAENLAYRICFHFDIGPRKDPCFRLAGVA